MTKYRKRSVVVDAVTYEAGMEDGYACYYLDGKFIGYCPKDGPLPKAKRVPAIQTLQGFHEISLGDYIVTDIHGQRSIYKPDAFDLTYEIEEE